jgi:hypothetical protein
MIHAVTLPTGWKALVTWSDPGGGQPVSLATVILTCRLETPLHRPGRVAELGASLLRDAVTALEHVRNIAYEGWGSVPDGFRPDCARDVSALVRLIGKLRAPGCILVWEHADDGAIWTTIQSEPDQMVLAGKVIRVRSRLRRTKVIIPPIPLSPIPEVFPFQTAQAVTAVTRAALSLRSERHWTMPDDDGVKVFKRTDTMGRVAMDVPAMTTRTGIADTDFIGAVKDGALIILPLIHVMVALVRESLESSADATGFVQVDLDMLMPRIGVYPRASLPGKGKGKGTEARADLDTLMPGTGVDPGTSGSVTLKEAREKSRRTIWVLMNLVFGLTYVGGTIRKPLMVNGKKASVPWNDPLFVPDGNAGVGSQAPQFVRFGPSVRFVAASKLGSRGLPHLGDFSEVFQLRKGKARSSWGSTMLYAIAYLVRTESGLILATRVDPVEPSPVVPVEHLPAAPKPGTIRPIASLTSTPRVLLTMFRCTPDPAELLARKENKRVAAYYKAAVTWLATKKFQTGLDPYLIGIDRRVKLTMDAEQDFVAGIVEINAAREKFASRKPRPAPGPAPRKPRPVRFIPESDEQTS